MTFSQKDSPYLLSLSTEIRQHSYQEWKKFKHPKINSFTTWDHEVQESFQVYLVSRREMHEAEPILGSIMFQPQLCYPFTIIMSQLFHLSAWRVFDVFQHIMFSRTFQCYILVLGNCHELTYLSLMPAGRGLGEELRECGKPDDHIHVAISIEWN